MPSRQHRQLVRAVIAKALAQRDAHDPVIHAYTFTFSDRTDDGAIVYARGQLDFRSVEAMRLVANTSAKIAIAGARVQGNLATAL